MAETKTIEPRAERMGPEAPLVLQLLFTPVSGLAVGAPHPLQRGPNRIGRSASIEIPDAAVSRLHAVINVDANASLTLEDQSSHGTFRWGQRVQRVGLSPGDVLRMGNSLMILRKDDRDETPPPVVEGFIGDAPSMRELRRSIHLVARENASVFLHGESGTGKDVVARAIHAAGDRNGAFVAVNCSAIPETLAESQLFGHVKGAFTGATEDHRGFFEQADGGTLFLDEVGELPLSLQPKLLRALEEQEVTPLGATTRIPCRPRVVAATNLNLDRALADQTFRLDLYTRLTDLTLVLAPLRDRREDIVPILASVLPSELPPLTPGLVEALLIHEWPGNVRELLKVGRELALRGAGQEEIGLSVVKHRLRHSDGPRPPFEAQSGLPPDAGTSAPPSRETLVALLNDHEGNVSSIARAIGRSRRQLRRYFEVFELDPSDYRRN